MFDQQSPDDPDERLLAELVGFFERRDPVPDDVMAAARAAIELRDLDAQLASLLSDSAIDDQALAGVHGGSTRLLTFSVGEDRFVEVDVAVDGGGRALTGYVVPGGAGELTVEHASGASSSSALDAQGRFHVGSVSPGPVRLRFTLTDERPLVTEWLSL